MPHLYGPDVDLGCECLYSEGDVVDDGVQQADDQPHSVQTDGCGIDLWRLCHAKQTHQKTAHGNYVCGERRKKGRESGEKGGRKEEKKRKQRGGK